MWLKVEKLRATNANRIAILNGIASEFGIATHVPSIFDGIPVLNNLKATFYGFKDDRKAGDIDNLWSLFETALVLADNDTADNRRKFSDVYDMVHDQLCIRWNITMGLYWIRPYSFINLDSRNRWFIANAQNMPGEFVVAAEKKLKKVPYAADYLEIKDLCKKVLDAGQYEYKSFPDLSYTAWIVSEKVNQEKSVEKGKKTSKAEFLKWFMPLLQALRDLGGSATPAEARKKIIENEHLSDEVINETRGKTQVNKFENEVAFARNYLVGAGYIDKSVRGVWTLTEAGKTVELTAEMASDIFKKGVSDAKSNKTNDSDALADNDIDTVRYWLYAPGQGADKWEECYKNGYMLLGWGEIGDLGVFSSKDEMKQQMKQEYGDSSSYKNSAHATWQFVHDIRVGDVVFVKKGNNGMLRGGISDPRNKTLMKMFNMIGIGERAGSGILDIFQVWGNEGWAVPVVEESYNPDRTRLTLEFAKKQAGKPNDKKQTTKTEIHREKIRNFLTENELASAIAISMVIGLSAERTRVILAKMEDAESVGGNRNRKYKLRTEKQFDKEPPWTEKTKP